MKTTESTSPPPPVLPIHQWREKVLNGVLQTTFAMSVFALLGGINLIVQTYRQEPESLNLVTAVLGIYLFCMALCGLITFRPRWNYHIRSLLLLLILYVLGVVGLIMTGLSSNGRIFLLAFVVMAAVLLGREYGLAAMTISILSLIFIAWLLLGYHLVIPIPRQANSLDVGSWISGIIVFVMVSAIITLSVTYLIQGLNQSLNSSQREQEYLTALLKAEEGHKTLLVDLQARANQLTALHETSLDIVAHRNVKELMEAIVERAAHLLNVLGGGVYLTDTDGTTVTLVAMSGPGQELIGTKLKRGQGVAGHVLETAVPLIVTNYDAWPGRANIYPQGQWSSVLAVPMKLQNHVAGVITCHERIGTPRIFDEADQHLLEQLAQQAALALENAQLLNTANRRAEELDAVIQLGRVISANLDLGTVLQTTYHCVGELMPNEAFWIAAYKPGAAHYQHLIKIDKGNHFPIGHMSLEIGVAGHTIKTGQPVILHQSEIEYRFSQAQYGTPDRVQSILCVPLQIGEQIIGAMSVQSYTANAYTTTELNMLSQLGQFVAIALENARLYEETRQRASELEVLASLSAVLRTAVSVDDMLPLILQKALEAVQAPLGAIFLIEPETGEFRVRAFHPPNLELSVTRPSDGITRQVLTTRQVHIWEDNSPDALIYTFRNQPIHRYLRSAQAVISVPLHTQEQILGVMHLGDLKPGAFHQEHVRLLMAFSDIASNALQRAKLLTTLEERVQQRTHELAHVNERLTELDKLKSKFIADISHELRTPVANIHLYLDLLRRSKPENALKYLTVLQEKTDWLVQFTERILDISRLEGVRDRQEFTAVNLNDILHTVITIYQPLLESKGVIINFNPHHTPLWVWGNHNHLTQAVTHLVSNALNYTTQGQVAVCSGISEATQQACFKVKDTGIGIGAEDLPHIFDRFYRGQQVGQLNIPGYGLGLAIVQEIIQLHGGSVEVESTPGEGSTFTVLLPCYQPEKGVL